MARAATSLRVLAGDGRGAIGIALALLFVPLVMVVGAAVDYARLEQFKTQLQTTVDAAALSGASAYVDSSSNGNAVTVADNYLASNEALLPSHIGNIRSTVSATQVSSGSNQGYTVSVSATGQIDTTFMRLVTATLNVSASATAVNPIVQITITTNNFKSSAWDGNTLWYWLISASSPNAQPNVSQFASGQEIASNMNSSNPEITFKATATQQIGIALQNVTGEKGGNYGCTQYQTAQYVRQSGQYVEDCQGTTQWFFSNMMPPSNDTYNEIGYQQVSKNCSVQTALTTSLPTTLTPPISGQCFDSLPQYSYLSCAQLNGEWLTFYWNDMGGNTDDYDFNDAEISLQCSPGSGNSATNVYLSS